MAIIKFINKYIDRFSFILPVQAKVPAAEAQTPYQNRDAAARSSGTFYFLLNREPRNALTALVL